jgi:hypothetical protein
VKVYTAHLRAARSPVLLREGFSWPALIFGPLWFLAHRAWLAALACAAAHILIATLVPPVLAGPLSLCLALAQGLFGTDILRATLAGRGYVLAHVVAARDADAALGRLVHARPDLAAEVLAEGMPK